MDLKTALAQLSQRLPEEAVERTKTAQTKKGYDTTGYGYQWIVDRMNEVLGIDGWRAYATYEVEEYTTRNGADMYEVTAFVTIELIRVDADGRRIVLADRSCHGGHASLTKADALKGAFTNGFKKTAALFGVGASAYRGTIDDDNTPRPEEPGHSTRKPAPAQKPTHHRQGGQQHAEQLRAQETKGGAWDALETAATLFGGRLALLRAIGWGDLDWPRSDGEAEEALVLARAEHRRRSNDQRAQQSQGRAEGDPRSTGVSPPRQEVPTDRPPPSDSTPDRGKPTPDLRVVPTSGKPHDSQPAAKQDANQAAKGPEDGARSDSGTKSSDQAGQTRSAADLHTTLVRMKVNARNLASAQEHAGVRKVPVAQHTPEEITKLTLYLEQREREIKQRVNDGMSGGAR